MSDAFAKTPRSPYYAVIFTSVRTEGDQGYGAMAARMDALARTQPGYLGIESARDADAGITVSYWSSLEAIRNWRQNAEHLLAQEQGKKQWYRGYRVRISRVERDYGGPEDGL